MGFSRKYRLVSKEDFQAVFAKPHKISHKCFLILYCQNQASHARLGLIIAKHHVKEASRRNKLRRLIRESFRQQKIALAGLDIIILLRSKCAALTSKADQTLLRADIEHLWPLINQHRDKLALSKAQSSS